MPAAEILNNIVLTFNDLSFIAGIIVSALFYRQYKKYAMELEREEILEQFLKN